MAKGNHGWTAISQLVGRSYGSSNAKHLTGIIIYLKKDNGRSLARPSHFPT